MQEGLKSNRKRNVLIALTVIGSLILFTQLTVMFYIDPKAEQYISRKVNERTRGQYSLRFENISINIFTQRISAKSVYLTPEALPDTVKKWRPDEMELFFPEVSVQGLGLWSAVWDRKLVISQLKVEKPRIKLKRNSQTDANPAQYKKHINYYRALRGMFNAALIKNIEIEDGYLELYRLLDEYNYVATVESFDLRFKDVLLDSLVTGKDKGYMDIGALSAKLSAFSQRSPDSTYLLSVGHIDISSSQSYFHVKDINVVPLQDLNEEDVKQNIIYELYVPEFNLDGIDIKELYDTRSLKLTQVKVAAPAIKLMGHNQEGEGVEVQEVNFYPLISEYIKTLHIDKILLDDAKLDVVNTENGSRANLEKVDIFLYGFKMDSSLLQSREKLFYSDRVFLKVKENNPMLLENIDMGEEFIDRLNR